MPSADSVKPFKPLHNFNDSNGFNDLNDRAHLIDEASFISDYFFNSSGLSSLKPTLSFA